MPTGAGGKRAVNRGRVRLVALLDGRVVGSVWQVADGKLRFVYEDDWRSDAEAYPLSLSLPLTAQEHPNDPTLAFLWGLLPDNDRTLHHYARRFNVSQSNPVALLERLGADCAGAVQFAPPDGVEALLEANRSQQMDVEWLDETAVARELREVRERGIPGVSRLGTGQFSLAGAQPKTALLEMDGRWGRPTGRTPTNRILKPPAGDLRDFAENEHLCLSLASALGLGAASSRVQHFEGEVAIVLERFDRVLYDGAWRRIHQEDICQALGVHPLRKYQNEGGPGIENIVALLRDVSEDSQGDVHRLLAMTMLNWILVGTDAHAKNFALLHRPRRATRLAPFYDIASYLPYADAGLHRMKMAMSIGGEYRVRRIGRSQWSELARANGISEGQVLQLLDDILNRLPSALHAVVQAAVGDGLSETVVTDFADRVGARVEACGGLNPPPG